MKTKIIKLSDIVIDAGTQQREKINDDIVAEYAESIKCGSKFPPIIVFSDGVNYYLADGFHRVHAHRSAEINDIEADIHDGTLRDAKLQSFAANKNHGLRRSQADKRKAVLEMIADEVWGEWPSRDIANHIGVSHTYVNNIRNDIEKSKENLGNVAKESLKPALNLETDKKLSTGEECKSAEAEAKEFTEFDESQLMAEIAEGCDPEKEYEDLKAENEELKRIIESDDQLKEIKRLTELCRVIEERARGYQSSENAAVRKAKMWKEKFEKLERQVKAAGLVEF